MDTTELKLPSGKIAKIRAGKGRDVMAAQRIAGTDPDKLIAALVAIRTEIDGAKMSMEQMLDELSDVDYIMLYGEVGKGFAGAETT